MSITMGTTLASLVTNKRRVSALKSLGIVTVGDKGYKTSGNAAAGLSTMHTLALTNRGGATAADIVRLAKTVQDGVERAYGIRLVPEPVIIGMSLK